MIVVTGGAGYIGSHVVRALGERALIIVDDLRTGHRDLLEKAPHIEADIADAQVDWDKAEGVIHLAGSTSVAESVNDPEKYRINNLLAAQKFLAPALERKLPIVYSSTAAVYGEPEQTPIREDHVTRPINPYGETKLKLEQWLLEGGTVAALRYFNAAGGDERHDPETHLIPLVLGGRGPFSIFGKDYPTEDGTCVRDFVHVEDLARAHVLALGKKGIWNLGCGKGVSVLEVVRRAGREPKFESRRPGDPAVLVADISKAREELNWEPKWTLDDILSGK